MTDPHVTVERRLSVSADRAWEALTDLQGMPAVLTGVESVEVLTPGPFAVGTRWRETRRMFGKQATEEMSVTACERPKRYVVEAESAGTHYVSEFSFDRTGPETTTVRMHFSARPPGGFAGLLAKVFGALGTRAVEKAVAKDLADVAASLERPGGRNTA
ncbi:SRPBCC family protein [Streptomyces sp. NPDC051219]|uniref:SRPBCC family protein n=1 Tax=Streptomyces sp. NPDC051219 TaxID=3155283 RepID=UPI00343FBDA2